MGTVAFLLGDGRYGIFEILKHVTPGLICDLLVPLVVARRPHARARIAWSLVGGVIAVGRFATIFAIVARGAGARGRLRASRSRRSSCTSRSALLSGYVSYHLRQRARRAACARSHEPMSDTRSEHE